MIKKTINNPNKEDGPLHIVNDRSGRRRQRIRVAKKVENNIHLGLVFSVGGCVYHKCEVEDPMPQLTTSTLNVLNKYFDPNDALSLSNKIEPTSTYPYLDTLVNEILKSYNIRKRGGRHSRKTSKQKPSYTRKLK